MNNVSPINKAQRLTEEEVHAAAEELQEAGGKVTSLELYKHLGRGSLTTISNFLKSWKSGEENTNTLPALVMMPEALKAASEQLIIKVWAEAQKLSEAELNNQREALRQAETLANAKIEEAQAFSEEQTVEIEKLKDMVETLKNEKGEILDEINKLRINEVVLKETIKHELEWKNEQLDQIKELKDEIKRIEYERQREIDEARKIERELQSDKAMLLVEVGIQKEKISSLLKADEANKEEITALINDYERQEEKHKGNVEEICRIRNMAIEERNETVKEMAKLEGKLEEAWKVLKSKEETENKSNKKKNSELNYKQVEITD